MAENSGPTRQRLAGLQHCLVGVQEVEHVVAGQCRDAHLQAQSARQRDDRLRAGNRIRGAHVGDDAHTILLDERQQSGLGRFHELLVVEWAGRAPAFREGLVAESEPVGQRMDVAVFIADAGGVHREVQFEQRPPSL